MSGHILIASGREVLLNQRPMKSDASSLIKSERIQYCYRETCPVDVCVMAEIYVTFAPVNRLLNDWSF